MMTFDKQEIKIRHFTFDFSHTNFQNTYSSFPKAYLVPDNRLIYEVMTFVYKYSI